MDNTGADNCPRHFLRERGKRTLQLDTEGGVLRGDEEDDEEGEEGGEGGEAGGGGRRQPRRGGDAHIR